MPLMGSLYVGTSGLRTSQSALNTTAHNLSNLDTKDYTRQQTLLSNSPYLKIEDRCKLPTNSQIGLGVTYAKVRQVRDYFLDKTYRAEVGRESFYNVSSKSITEVETLLDELDGEAFVNSLDNLWTSVQEFSKDPSSLITQGMMVQNANTFLLRAGIVYKGLVSYQNNLNNQIKEQVEDINKYANQIMALNEAIARVEGAGVENANDLRDRRNAIIDKLSKMGHISVAEQTDTTVRVQFEGVDLVNRGWVNEIGLDQNKETGFYTPYWVLNATKTKNSLGEDVVDISSSKVYDMTRPISAKLNTDIGSLKGILLARGDRHANYSDVQDRDIYNNGVQDSIVMNMQAEFDQLIHNVAVAMNKVFSDAAIEESNIYPNSTYLRNADGSPIQIFSKLGSDGWTSNDGGVTWNYMAENTSRIETMYSITNLHINNELMQSPGKLGMIKKDLSVDYITANKLKEAFTNNDYVVNPNVLTQVNLLTYYPALVSQVANSGSVYNSVLKNQNATVESLSNSREEVLGVSSDEELTFMIKFQNAFNASSRYINVIDEMLEHLISTLGV